MINVEITADGYLLTDELRQSATEKFGSLEKYIKGLDQVHVVFTWTGGEGEQTTVHAQADGGGHRFEASATDRKAETALDATRHELKTQMSQQKSKEIDARDHRGHER